MSLTLAFFTASVLSATAAAPNGNDILRDVDAALEKTRSQVLTMDMAIEDPGHEPRHIGLQMHMRGDRRRIAFLYPGDMKGMRVLNLSAEQTYVYLPAFRKVRRVASHLRDQTMFGSDYTFDDFGNIALHRQYDGTVVGEDPQFWTIEAKPKKKLDQGVSRLQLRVNKKLRAVEELKFFGPQGDLARTETRSDYQCDDDGCAPRKTKMVDHRHDNHWTEVTIKELQLNAPISDQVFSLRTFQSND